MLFSDLILKRALRRRGSNLKAPVITDTVIQEEQMNKNRLVSGSSMNRRKNTSFSRKCMNEGKGPKKVTLSLKLYLIFY